MLTIDHVHDLHWQVFVDVLCSDVLQYEGLALSLECGDVIDEGFPDCYSIHPILGNASK